MKLKLPTLLDYNNGTGIVPEGEFRIGASGIADFFTDTRKWFGDNLMGEKSFSGNQATLIGTCMHFCAEQFAKHQSITEEAKKEINNYILKSTNSDYEDYIEDTDAEHTVEHYKLMAQTLLNDYVSINMPVCVEPFITTEVLPGIHVGGSIDCLFNGRTMSDNTLESLRDTSNMVICDYKSTSTVVTRLPDLIQFKHRLQLLTYAYVLRQEYNILTDRIRIIYCTKTKIGAISEKTGKQLKSYPSETKILTEPITEQDYNYIEGIIKLIGHSVKRWKEVPADRYLLAKDWRLHPSQQGVQVAVSTKQNLFEE